MTIAILVSKNCARAQATEGTARQSNDGSKAERLSRWRNRRGGTNQRRGQETKRGRTSRRRGQASEDSSQCSRRATLQAIPDNPENGNNLRRWRRRALCDSRGRRLHYQRWARSSDRSSRRPILQSQPPPRKPRRLSGVVAALQ